jgi:hypothetical protein
MSFEAFIVALESEKTQGLFSSTVRDSKKYYGTGADIYPMTLVNFLMKWKDEIMDVFDLEEYNLLTREFSLYEVLCLVDTSDMKISTMDSSMRKKFRRAGKLRRDKLKRKFHYSNPFNRIHAFAIIEDQPGKAEGDTLSISSICSSNYSDVKGLGNFIMKQIIEAAKVAEYDNIVLEVGNDEATTKKAFEGESDEEESDEEESDEEEEEYEDYEELIDVVSNFMWRKSVRHEDGDPYYSFDEEYLRSTISSYLYDYDYSSCEHEDIDITLDDEEYSYGGHYYTLGKRKSKPLFNFYEKHGFVEDSKVNLVWQCFTETPYPSMILDLKK